jgi:hypothetical protein
MMTRPHYHDDYAGKHHRHDDAESVASGLREDLGHAEERIRELEDRHDSDIRRLWDHIASMPGGA